MVRNLCSRRRAGWRGREGRSWLDDEDSDKGSVFVMAAARVSGRGLEIGKTLPSLTLRVVKCMMVKLSR